MSASLFRKHLTSIGILGLGLCVTLLLTTLSLPSRTHAQRVSAVIMPAVEPNCTYTIGYWKTHPADWPVSSLAIGGIVYTKAQLLSILSTPSNGDATYLLAHQLIAAKLNIAQGADGTAVAKLIANADSWLVDYPLGSNVQGAERELGVSYAAALNSYNRGVTGPGHCGTTTPTPVLTTVPTATPMPTATPEPTVEPTPEPTPDPGIAS